MSPIRTSVLVVVAHPDDAEIAVGGTIAALTAAGSQVVVAVLTMPEGDETASMRRAATEQAAELLGYELRWVAAAAHRQVVGLGEVGVVREVDRLVRDLQPGIVMTHWGGDSHVDHVTTARAVAAASRTSMHDLYHFRPGEVRTPAFSRFSPNTFVDISGYAERKAAALAPFCRPRPGFRALSQDAIDRVDLFYGAQIARDRAEGFVVGRQRGIGGALLSP